MPGGPSSKSIRGALSWGELIPLPFSGGAWILPHLQLVKFVTESVLCASSSFLYLSLMSLHVNVRQVSQQWSVPTEFNFYLVSSMRRALVSIRSVSHFEI